MAALSIHGFTQLFNSYVAQGNLELLIMVLRNTEENIGQWQGQKVYILISYQLLEMKTYQLMFLLDVNHRNQSS